LVSPDVPDLPTANPGRMSRFSGLPRQFLGGLFGALVLLVRRNEATACKLVFEPPDLIAQ
jgi:hypothetical protein